MASLRLRGKKHHIYIRFQYNGKQLEEKTGFLCTGKDPQKCFRCKGHLDAERFKIDIEEALLNNRFVYSNFFQKKGNKKDYDKASNGLTFEKYYNILIEERNLSYSTAINYNYIYKNYFKDTLGDLLVKEININNIKEIKEKFTDVSFNSQNYIMAVLKSVFNFAIKDEIIDINPVRNIILPKKTQRQVYSYTIEEVNLIINYFKENYEKYLLFPLIGFFLGLRTGELLSLKWSDFDFKNNKVKIQRTLTRSKIKESTKTTNFRIITIPPILDEYLKEYFNRRVSDWVFQSEYRQEFPLSHCYFFRIWKSMTEELNIPYRKIYTMRHTYAVLSLEAGIPYNTIKHTLGHSDLSMLMKVYANVANIETERIGLNLDGQIHKQ